MQNLLSDRRVLMVVAVVVLIVLVLVVIALLSPAQGNIMTPGGVTRVP